MSIFKIFLSIIGGLVAVLSVQLIDIVRLFRIPDKPTIKETWWGTGDPLKEDQKIYPFKINISQNILDDLQYRLEHTRPFAKPLENNQWYGFNGELAQDVLNYWKTSYNWRDREKYLNKFPQYITSVQGLKIHFVHVKPKIPLTKNVKILPLLLLHGWPSSPIEYYRVFDLLTTYRDNQSFVFEVIAPHQPGFVFSEGASKPGLGAVEIALVLKNLMNRLGFEKFYIQGGDLGGIVLQAMSINFEDSILGYHSNLCVSVQPYSLVKVVLGSMYPGWVKNIEHRKLIYPLKDLLSFLFIEFGYLHVHSTKPDTYGISLDDSPMGLAALHLEKFSTGTDFDNRFRKDGGLTKYSYDDLLDIIMLYWTTQSGTSAIRLYAEIFNKRAFTSIFWLPVKVPVACVRLNNDFIAPDGIIRDTYLNLVQVSDYNGGHFVGLEQPYNLANDIYQGIAKIEKNYGQTNETCMQM